MMVMMLSLIKAFVLMKNIIFLALFAFVNLISCSSSPECEYLESMGRGYDKNNQKIKELNIKIGKCPKQGSGFMVVIDSECKERLLKEFNEQDNCNKQ